MLAFRCAVFCLQADGIALTSAGFVFILELTVNANECLGGGCVIWIEAEAVAQGLFGFGKLVQLE